MLDGLKIRCIGFSVTGYGEPPYPDVMNDIFKSNSINAHVTHSSVGGLSIDSLPYALGLVLKRGEADLVILEIATSWYSFVRKDLEEAVSYIKLILDYLENIKVRIIFLNLYRRDIDDNDIVVKAINIASNGKYPVMSLKEQYRELLANTGDDQTTDGVHPIQAAVEHIAQTICDFVMSKYDSLKIHYPASFDSKKYNLITLPINSDMFEFDNHHGFSVTTSKIYQGQTISLNFNEITRISGFFFLYGPNTNYLKIKINEHSMDIPMKDDMSFYRRIGYRYLNRLDTMKVEIFHPHDLLDIKLQREPWEKSLEPCNYIIGFSSDI